MKNQYYGDINDYRKYGLLRILSGDCQFHIGVCWMLTKDDGQSDGKKIIYLNDPQKWRQYDPLLFDHLHQVVRTDRCRNVRLLQSERILPGARFYDEFLPDSKEHRQAYFEQMRCQLDDSDLIFFDPDNGVEVKSVPKGRKDSSKYIFWDELKEVFQAGKSVLVYQHFPHVQKDDFTTLKVSEYKDHFGASKVYWFRTPHVIYFLAAQPQHNKWIQKCANKVKEKWGRDNQFLVG